MNDNSGISSQFLPQICVDQTSGYLAISYADASEDPLGQNKQIVMKVALSRDGGKTFSRCFRVSVGLTESLLASDNPCEYSERNVLGDYLGLDFHSAQIFPVWADNSAPFGYPGSGPKDTELYTARLKVSY